MQAGDGVTDRVALRWGGDDGDGIGKLPVTASANGYAGQSGAWFSGAAIIDFAHEIQAHPVPAEDIAISGGFGPKDGRPAQEHVGIRVRPVGSVGQVGMRIHLSTELWVDQTRTPAMSHASAADDVRAAAGGTAGRKTLGQASVRQLGI